MKRVTTIAVETAILVWIASMAAATSVTYSDSSWAGWTLAPHRTSGGFSSLSFQGAIGNRAMTTDLRAPVAPSASEIASSVLLFESNSSLFEYDPAIDGEIASVDLSLWIGPGSQDFSLLLRQNAKTYLAALGDDDPWESFDVPGPLPDMPTYAGLLESDFLEIAFPGLFLPTHADLNDFVDAQSHPDFSSDGEPITVGLIFLTSTELGGAAVMDQAQFRRFEVTLVPEPGSAASGAWALATLGALRAVLVRRRREVAD